jgi:hypothetical protein
MSKKKKPSKDPWVNFVRSVFSRKRVARGFKLPKTYLESLADRLHRVNPTKAIVYHTLVDVYCKAGVIEYTRCQDDQRFFRDKQKQAFERDWNAFKDEIDDMIHLKSNVTKTA